MTIGGVNLRSLLGEIERSIGVLRLQAVWLRVRAELRARGRASIGLVLVIGLAGGLVIAAAAGARRTDSTFGKFRLAHNTAQVGVANPAEAFGFANVDFDKAERLPQITDSARFSFFIAFMKTSRGKTLTPIGDQNPVVLFASADGRFDRDLNRMLIVQGRRSDPSALGEVDVSYVAAKSYDLHIGDTIDGRLPLFSDFSAGPSVVPHGAKFHLQVVGIEIQSWELPPGTGYPEMHLTPAFYKRYHDGTPTFPALLMKLHRDSDVPIVADELQRTAIVHTPGVRSSDRIQLFDETANARAIQRSAHLQAIALWLLAALAGIASVLILGQAIVRESFLDSLEYPTLRALGMTSEEMLAAGFVRMLVMGAAGCVVAIVVAVAVSPVMPIGLSRLVDPYPGISFDVRALAIGGAGLLTVIAAIAAIAASRAAHGAERSSRETQRPSRIAGAMARSSFPPSSVAGVRMALEVGRGRTAVPVRSTLFGTIVGLAALVTAFGFGASIDHLLATPRLVGWNWSGIVGDPFDSEDAMRVIPRLQADPDVAEFSGGGSGAVRIRGVPVDVIAMDPVKGAIGPLIVGDGRAPRAIDEIALGPRTLRQIHAGVGDDVTIALGTTSARMRIVGLAIVPPAFNGGAGASGAGGWMTFQGLRRLGPGTAEDVFAFRFAEGVDPKVGLGRMKHVFPDLAVVLSAGQGEVGNLKRVSGLPVVLAGVLALIAAATLAHTLVSVVRRRGRDLAILKTLGFVRGQVWAAVAWQGTTLVGLSLLLGIPLGIVAGRSSWTFFANQLGVIPEPVVPMVPILIAIPAALILGNAIAAWPGRSAARTRPAHVLRSE